MWTYKRNSGNGIGIKGAVASTAKIASVKDLSGTEHPRLKKTYELYLVCNIEVGRDFQPEFEVFGDFKRNAQGEIEKAGSAFKVGEFFANARKAGEKGAKGLELVVDSNDRIPKDLLDALVGRSFSYVRYVKGQKPNGKPRWVNWDLTGEPGKDQETLNYFQEKVRKDKYLRENWTPDVIKDPNDDDEFDPKEFADTPAEDDSTF